ncbi:MAG: VWA domain-containing protein [Planctomycetales bacterium]|nr:VWA domain-containing protein [Planctomycetales bacterium]
MRTPFYTARKHQRSGTMVVLVAITLVILLICAVFSIDVAYMHMVRAELRTATDAAARAGTETLARTQDIGAATAAALAIAKSNRVAGVGLTLDPSNLQFGSTSETVTGRRKFLPGALPSTAMRVTGARTANSKDGEIDLFFSKLFDVASFEPQKTATAASNVRDVALVLDTSGSMNSSAGFKKSRIDALKEAVALFLSEIEKQSSTTRISLVSYSSGPIKQLDITDDFSAILARVNSFKANGSTDIGDSLAMGSDSIQFDSLTRPFAFKTIVLMTDGNHNTGPSPIATVPLAVQRGQTVHTITFGADANKGLMKAVAGATKNGIHIHADNAVDLTDAFREIARTLSVSFVE